MMSNVMISNVELRRWRRCGPCRTRNARGSLYAVVALVCVALAGCAGSDAPSAELQRIESQIILRMDDYRPPSSWETSRAPSSNLSVNLEDFAQSLFPFIEYALFGTRFPDEATMGHALDSWIQDHVNISDAGPDPYLFALMNVMLHPPEVFEETVALDAIVGQGSDGFENEHLASYVWLGRLWVDANGDLRPHWITIHH